jgi:hypothetical protein
MVENFDFVLHDDSYAIHERREFLVLGQRCLVLKGISVGDVLHIHQLHYITSSSTRKLTLCCRRQMKLESTVLHLCVNARGLPF